jgi:hypothetical protein
MNLLTYALVAGMLVAGYAVVALSFARFWNRTRDRLFVWFSCAFFTLAVQRVISVGELRESEDSAWLYLPRLLAFLLILIGILDKNRRARQ